MTLTEKIAILREKLEPWRFYLFRWARVFLLYYFYIIITDLATFSLPGGDPEHVNYNPMMYHGSGSISVLLGFILVCGLFVLYDPTARRHFAKNPPPEKTLFSEWLHVFKTYEFWADIAGLAVLPLFIKTEIFTHVLWLLFRRTDFSETEAYLLYLAIIFPLFFIIELFLRVRTRRHWRDLTLSEAMEKHFDWLAHGFLLLLLIVFYPLLSQIYSVTLIWAIAFILFPFSIAAIIAICIFAWLGSCVRALHIRRKFFRKLKKLCKAEDIEISDIYRPYLSVFLRKNHDHHFTVKRGGKTYACKMIAAKARNAQMVFLDEDEGYFKFGFQFRSNDVVFWRSRFYHSFEAEGADKKIYIISPVPYEIRAVSTVTAFQSEGTAFVKESKRFRVLDNASALYDATVFSGEGFLGALMRNCLDKNEL